MVVIWLEAELLVNIHEVYPREPDEKVQESL